MDASTIALFLTGFGACLVFLSLWIAKLAGGSWGWAPWGIFGPLGWIAAFALSGAMKAHEAADRRVYGRRRVSRAARPSR